MAKTATTDQATTPVLGTTEQADGDWVAERLGNRLDHFKRMIQLRHRHRPKRVFWLEQVHGAEVIRIEDQPEGQAGQADALVTDRPDTLLTVATADCVPVTLQSPKAVGVAHAGLAGVLKGVFPATVKALKRFGVKPKDLEVRLGPHICASCYQMLDRNLALLEEFPDSSKYLSERGSHRYFSMLDALTDQAAELGIGRIAADPRCTYHNAGLFSSRRNHTHRIRSYVMLASMARA
jgi:purine-nucleoside/S-methyl-5'-thioadenosine phosphorylase / adenosine deaminase